MRSPATPTAADRSTSPFRRHAGGADARSRASAHGRTVALYAASIAGALLLSALLVSATGGSARAVWSALIDGSIRSPGAWGLTLTTMAPLLIVAVGAIVATRAGLINIGQEGQLLIGACFAAYVAVRLPGPGPLVIAGALVAAAIGGGLWAGIAALLKVWRNVPEVLTTLLLTFIAFPLLTFALRHDWLLGDRAERTRHINSGEQIPFDTRLPNLDLFGNRIDSAVVLALGVTAVVAYLVGRTRLGARVDVLGLNPRAAQRFGVPRGPLTAAVLVASGCFAGVAGSVLLTGGASGDRLSVGYSGNFGWDGLLIALVARNRVLVAIPTAFVFAALRTGSSFLAATGVDRRMTDVVQALLVLALLIPPAIEHAGTFRAARRQVIAAEPSLAGSAA
ncbi:MAG TPA: ABC transporter permease [Desertimonas sp.]|nr:ABC transporter permease [Desertimonas sp.]